MRDRAARGRRGSSGSRGCLSACPPGRGAQVRRREPSRSAPLETVYPRIPGADTPDRGTRAGAGPLDQRAPACAIAGAGRARPQGVRRASGKFRGKHEAARSDPCLLRLAQREDRLRRLGLRMPVGAARACRPGGRDGSDHWARDDECAPWRWGRGIERLGEWGASAPRRWGRAAAATCGFVCGGRPT